jgi:hypothetical protein
MMSERNEYITAMDAFHGGFLDAPLSPLSESQRRKSSMPPPATPKHDSDFWDSNLSEPTEDFTTSTAAQQNRETETPLAWMDRGEAEYEDDDDAHLFCRGAPSTERSYSATFSAGADTPSDWTKLIESSQPQEDWDAYIMAPPPSLQSFQSMNEKRVSTHQKQLESESGSENQRADLLHFACAINSKMNSKSFDAIETLALRDLSAAHRRMSDRGNIIMQKAVIASNKKLPKSVQRSSSWIKPRYTFPLNIAIQYNADPRVLELLVTIAPQVLEIPDGPDLESSLHIAIKHHCPTESIIDMMLLVMPSAAATKDRHLNTPLHLACLMRPEEDDLIRNLLLHHPGAAKEQNFHGHTPLMLLQRSNQQVSESTLNLMQRR